ncbi:MAG: hypothetical protein ACHP8A_06670, partial [Terriglobales bacterium]
MKYPLLAILLSVSAFAQTGTLNTGSAVSPASASIPVDQQDQKKAKNLLDQMIQALGGQAYLNIQEVSQEGRTYSF